MKKILSLSFLFSLTLFVSCKKEELPQLTTYEISGITVNSAVSGGVITSDGGSEIISRGVCCSEDHEVESSNKRTSDGAGTGSFVSNLSGLKPGTTYYLKAYATNSVGTQYGQEISFTTSGSLPQSTGAAARNILTTTATLYGTINPGDLPTTVSFEYGTSTGYGTLVSVPSPVVGNTGVEISVNIVNLSPGTPYHFRIKAENELGTTYGPDQTFVTYGQKPSFTAFVVASGRSSSASLVLNINPNHLATTLTVEYGVSESYGNTLIPFPNPFTGHLPMSVSFSVVDLIPGTLYHFRIKLENVIGITFTEDLTFKTYNATDIDYNGYYSVVIGTQEWLTSNLKATRFQNGDQILNVPDAYQWSSLTGPGYCLYKNENPGPYGNLYNFYVASDSRNVCPAGWHVPSMTELNTLIAYLGGEIEADGKLREAGLAHWIHDTGATNSTGFTYLPGGDRESDGTFVNRASGGYVWSSTPNDPDGGMLISMDWNAPKIFINPYGLRFGASIRCIKN